MTNIELAYLNRVFLGQVLAEARFIAGHIRSDEYTEACKETTKIVKYLSTKYLAEFEELHKELEKFRG